MKHVIIATTVASISADDVARSCVNHDTPCKDAGSRSAGTVEV